MYYRLYEGRPGVAPPGSENQEVEGWCITNCMQEGKEAPRHEVKSRGWKVGVLRTVGRTGVRRPARR